MTEKDMSPEEARGRRAGKAGAAWMPEAEVEELARLNEIYERSGADWERLFEPLPNNTFSPAEKLYFLLHPDDEGDRQAAALFWKRAGVGVEDALDLTFICGFAECALVTRYTLGQEDDGRPLAFIFCKGDERLKQIKEGLPIGVFTTAAWDNDTAADWLAGLFSDTIPPVDVEGGFAKYVEDGLNRDPAAEPEVVRAAAYLLVATDRLDRLRRLAAEKLELVRAHYRFRDDIPEERRDELVTDVHGDVGALQSRLVKGGEG